jgi:hypothetical protein
MTEGDRNAGERLAAIRRWRRFAPDSALEEAVLSELVSEAQIPLLAGKIQGILFVWASECGCWFAIL